MNSTAYIKEPIKVSNAKAVNLKQFEIDIKHYGSARALYTIAKIHKVGLFITIVLVEHVLVALNWLAII